jgi:hypothetical protein
VKPITLDYRRKPVSCKLRREDKGTHAIWRISPPTGYLRPNPVIETPKGREVLVLIDPKQATATHYFWGEATNVPDRFGFHRICWTLMLAAGQHHGIGLALGNLAATKPDRAYFETSLASKLERERGAWSTDPVKLSRKMHEPHEPGYELVGSWRSRRKGPSLQVTIWKTLDDRIPVAELDVDYKRGLGHVIKEVIPNAVLRRKTDPIIAAQLCAWFWVGFELPFTLGPGA